MELIPGLDRSRLALGEIRVNVRLENFVDLEAKRRNKRRKVRALSLEAVADTGAVLTLLPEEVVDVLGLRIFEKVVCTLANDQKIELPKASGLWITVAGRSTNTSCLVGPPGCTALIGQTIMEELDLIADPGRCTLTVRPESPIRPTLGLRAAAMLA